MTDNKIVSVDKAIEKVGGLKFQKKTIVLTGGCFDILHKGHIRFLNQAKKTADILVVMLESDEAIKSVKGQTRPINSQKDRAYILSHLQDVDIIILLEGKMSNNDYDELIFSLKPDIIATTKGDQSISHKKRQAKRTNARLEEVVENVENASTSRVAELLEGEF